MQAQVRFSNAAVPHIVAASGMVEWSTSKRHGKRGVGGRKSIDEEAALYPVVVEMALVYLLPATYAKAKRPPSKSGDSTVARRKAPAKRDTLSTLADFVQARPIMVANLSILREVQMPSSMSDIFRTVSEFASRAVAAAPAGVGLKGGRLYEVIYKPEIAKKLSEGSLTMQKAIGGGHRAAAVDPLGVIRGNGRLIEVSKRAKNLATMGAFAFHAASFVVSQEHMAQITKQLKALTSKVDAIHGEHQSERIAQLAARIRQMHVETQLLEKGLLSEERQSRVIDSLRKTDELFDQYSSWIELELAKIVQRLRNERFAESGIVFPKTAAIAEKFDSIIAEIVTLRSLEIAALNMLGCAAQLSAALTIDDDYSKPRLDWLRERLCRRPVDLYQLVRERAERDFHHYFASAATIKRYRDAVISRVLAIENSHLAERQFVRDALDRFEEAEARKRDGPTDARLLVEVDENGHIARFYHADATLAMERAVSHQAAPSKRGRRKLAGAVDVDFADKVATRYPRSR